jgi:uncharacterized membrane protein
MRAAFDRDQALRFGWQAMKQNLGFFVAWVAIDVGASLLFAGARMAAEARIPALPIATTVMDNILHIVVAMGVIHGTLTICDGRRPRVADLFGAMPRIWSYLGVSLLLFLMLIPGMVVAMLSSMLVFFAACRPAGAALGKLGFAEAILVAVLLAMAATLPVMLKYGFAQYAAIEGASPRTALRASARITDGHKMDLLVFGLITFGMNLLGLLCFGVGLLFTLPTSVAAHAWVYRQLRASVGTKSFQLITS